MSKIWSKIKNFYITNSQQEAEFSKSREKEVLGRREIERPAAEVAAVFDIEHCLR